MAHAEEGLRIAQAVEQPDSLINAYSGLGFLHLRKGDLAEAIAILERGFGLYQDWQIPLLFPLIASALGAAYALSGRVSEALPLLEQAVSHAASMGEVDFQSHRLACLSEAYLQAGHVGDAMALGRRALELSRAHKERGWEAYALHLLGNTDMRRNPPEYEEAEVHYRRAQALAVQLHMRPLQAHCHLGLGRLYAQTRRQEQAGAELAAASALYRAMAMTFWLPKAEAALVQVGCAAR
jgi:tetratricopeptide (TPR) repeat protein